MPFSVREGINIFLSGFLPTENMRFRDVELNFKVSDNSEGADAGLEEMESAATTAKDDKKKENKKSTDKKPNAGGGKADREAGENTDKKIKAIAQEDTMDIEDIVKRRGGYLYPSMSKTLGTFKLEIEKGYFRDSQITVMLGENGTGKTTFVKMLAGLLQPDDNSDEVPEMNISYKPQKISPTFEGLFVCLFLLFFLFLFLFFYFCFCFFFWQFLFIFVSEKKFK